MKYVAERAKAQPSAVEARPLRDLLSDWFKEVRCELEGFLLLKSIDDHFSIPAGANEAKEVEMMVQLTDIVLGRFRKNATSANMLVEIIREIHRRMNIPVNESRPDDMRKSSWTWPHVMKVMKDRGVISDKANKTQFGVLIELILGDKVKPNSIRRANYGDYSIVDKYRCDLSDFDEDICEEILELFMPLLSTKN